MAKLSSIEAKFKREEQIKKYGYILLNILWWGFLMFPLIYAFLMAIKPSADLYNPNAILFPTQPTLSNFKDVFKVAPMGTYIRNTIFVAGTITILQIITSFLAGFAFRFLNFKGSKLVYALIISTMMVPGEAVIISQFLMVSAWGWTDTLMVLIVPNIVSAFNIFLAVQSLESFPYEVYESAKVDGCSDSRFVFTIMLPLLKPAIGSMAVRSFISAWNMQTMAFMFESLMIAFLLMSFIQPFPTMTML